MRAQFLFYINRHIYDDINKTRTWIANSKNSKEGCCKGTEEHTIEI